MIRLTGLPSVGRYPAASARREEASISILFSGTGPTARVDVPLDRLDPEEDLEAVELRLLADLQRRGYRVDRSPASPRS